MSCSHLIRKLSILLIGIFAISTPTFATGSSGRSIKRHVSVSYAFRHATRLEGETIRVRGFLSFRDDAKNLWQDRTIYRDAHEGAVDASVDGFDKCIALFWTGGMRQRLAEMNNTNVTIVGKIRTIQLEPGDINFDHCSNTGIEVSYVQS